MAANSLLNEKISVGKVAQIVLSDTTVCRRYFIAREASLFAFQLHEAANVNSKAQVIAFCMLAYDELSKVSAHYLF